MDQLVPAQEGGVVDFAFSMQSALGHDTDRVVRYSKDNVGLVRLNNDVVLLQYSGYGFEKRGAPLWLLRDLQRKRKDIRKLGVFFHELYGFAPPWRSSFWLSPLQRHVTRGLAELSDFWMTSRQISGQWLSRFADDKPHAVLPVYSTIGETGKYVEVRRKKIVVFGRSGLRLESYRAAGNRLFDFAKQHDLIIHDIGPKIQDAEMQTKLENNNVVQHGRLESDAVSLQLSDAMLGLITYPTDYVAKSSVFAAYCAHGVCPILLAEKYVAVDNLYPQQHYLSRIPDTGMDALKAISIGKSAWDWYQEHNISKHMSALKQFFEER